MVGGRGRGHRDEPPPRDRDVRDIEMGDLRRQVQQLTERLERCESLSRDDFSLGSVDDVNPFRRGALRDDPDDGVWASRKTRYQGRVRDVDLKWTYRILKVVDGEYGLRSGTTLIVDQYSCFGVPLSSTKGIDTEWCKVKTCLKLLKPYRHEASFVYGLWMARGSLFQVLEMGLLAPYLVVYLDIPREKAAERGCGGERYEQLKFRRKVSQHYNILHNANLEGTYW
ncbi:hypothetical protein HHK36_029947 [Tetracentron sinense]|uniref:Uncharacterized protein n=1 Tax=Tetracentron sinense TaxID=13715 RepID=A0A834YCL0_TETSI|nr:hypothetical protein HHK36_029947 [Tetracentron sinense]